MVLQWAPVTDITFPWMIITGSCFVAINYYFFGLTSNYCTCTSVASPFLIEWLQSKKWKYICAHRCMPVISIYLADKSSSLISQQVLSASFFAAIGESPGLFYGPSKCSGGEPHINYDVQRKKNASLSLIKKKKGETLISSETSGGAGRHVSCRLKSI